MMHGTHNVKLHNMKFYVYENIVCLDSNYSTRSYNVTASNYGGNCNGFFYELRTMESVQREQQLLLGIQTQ